MMRAFYFSEKDVKENTRRPVKSYDDVEEVVGGEERRCHSPPTSVDPETAP
jgi:hypothetical protein